jgi:hypothetical protein
MGQKGPHGRACLSICHEWNTVAHLVGYEGDQARRSVVTAGVSYYADE